MQELKLVFILHLATDVLHCINEEGTAPRAAEHISLQMEDNVKRRLTLAEFYVIAAELHYQHHPPPSLPSCSLPNISVPTR